MSKKTMIRIIAIICILIIPAYNLCGMLVTKNIFNFQTNPDLSEIKKLDDSNIGEVQQLINISESENDFTVDNDTSSSDYSKAKSNHSTDEVLKKVQSGETSYSKIFQNTLIAGDSLVEALAQYSILNEENVMGKVSASLYELQAISDKIISNHPDTLILHYGENHVGGNSQEYVDNFITFYTSLIENFKEKLPNTKIVISSIFLPNDQGLTSSPHLKSIPSFNEGLNKMCKELNVEYLDNSSLFSKDSDFYEPDGVHLKKIFYTDYWLPFIACELNLI